MLIDRSGRIAYVGHRDDADLHQALLKVIAEKGSASATQPATEVSKPDVLKVGDKIEGLKVTTLAGKTIDLSASGAKKPLGLVFFAPWCESYLAESQPKTSQACRRVRETVDRLAKQDNAINWIAVSSGLWASKSDLENYRATTGITIPLALDASDDLYRAFAIRKIPTVVLIGRDGTVIKRLGPQDRGLSHAVRSVSAQ